PGWDSAGRHAPTAPIFWQPVPDLDWPNIIPEPQPGFLLRAARLSARRGLVARTRCGGDGIRPRNDREGEHSPSSDHRGADPLVGRRPRAALAPAQLAR